MAELELFSYEACPYAQRTRMALIEKGLDFTLTEVDLYNKPDWFKKLSPYGKVPLLKHKGDIVYESRIINEYLEDAFPQRPLLPREPMQRAKAHIWIDYCDSYLMPVLHKMIGDRKDPAKLIEHRKAVAEKFLFMENEGLRKLSPGPYWLGSDVSLVDLQFMPFLERFPCYESLWGVAIPAECTRLKQWIATMQGRDSHKKTANTFEFHMIRYRKYDQAA
ncbi:MAG: glutathione S-transferase family protein [Rhodospirillaceae bacterium]|nr:glutathione S-transferase family protein [Rhodospirillaceae bacterium]